MSVLLFQFDEHFGLCCVTAVCNFPLSRPDPLCERDVLSRHGFNEFEG